MKNNKKSINKIDVLIVSDIHLGDNSTRCEELNDLLDRYKFKKLILNGDILNGLRLNRLHTNHWKLLSKFRKLSKNCEVIWIHGNHDPRANILMQLLGMKVYKRYIWKSNKKKFLAFHGHQFDRFLNSNYITSRIAYALYSFLRKIDKRGTISDYIKYHNKTWERSSLDVARGALRLGRILKADYVFCGHTHKIYIDEKWGIKYYNTGSWESKPSGFIIINNDFVELKELK